MKYAFILAVLLLSACCTNGAMRCVGNAVELCGTHGQWEQVADCSRIHLTDDTFKCVVIEGGKCRCRKVPK